MNYYAISEKGKREKNEDNFIAEKINDLYVFGVADGIGGHTGGEYASKIAIGELRESIKRKGEHGLKESFEKANSTIVRENERKNSNMGTTLVACVVKEKTGRYIVANVGDSRAYIFNETIWKTRSHNLVQELVIKGVINKEEAFNHPQKNVVTRALGLKKDVKTDVYNMRKGALTILLCSDGLSDYVNDADIAKIVRSYNPKKACNKLVKTALENGSKDNITIIIGDIKG